LAQASGGEQVGDHRLRLAFERKAPIQFIIARLNILHPQRLAEFAQDVFVIDRQGERGRIVHAQPDARVRGRAFAAAPRKRVQRERVTA